MKESYVSALEEEGWEQVGYRVIEWDSEVEWWR